MRKKVIDFNRLPKQEYIRPAIEVSQADLDMALLSGSRQVTTTGLGQDEELDYPEPTQPTTGSIWDDAM